MRKHCARRSLLLGGSLVVALLAFAGVASGTLGASKPTVYSACVPKSGIMRLVNSGASCPSQERRITWSSSDGPSVAGPTGATGPAGPTGAGQSAGAAGPTGATGIAGTPGATGTAGTVGATGTAGTTGATGTAGTAGATGTAGTAGATGATGPAGSNAVSGYAYYYNVASVSVAMEAAVPFDSNGLSTAGFTHTPGASAITVAAGVYLVSFTVSALQASQMAVFLNESAIAGALYGSGAGTQITSGQVIVSAAAGDVITVRNHSSAAAVTLQSLAGGTLANVNASITLQKLS
jgi:hypothetical protein